MRNPQRTGTLILLFLKHHRTNLLAAARRVLVRSDLSPIAVAVRSGPDITAGSAFRTTEAQDRGSVSGTGRDIHTPLALGFGLSSFAAGHPGGHRQVVADEDGVLKAQRSTHAAILAGESR